MWKVACQGLGARRAFLLLYSCSLSIVCPRRLDFERFAEEVEYAVIYKIDCGTDAGVANCDLFVVDFPANNVLARRVDLPVLRL